MRCRLLVTDLDGTLLDGRGQVSRANLQAIDRARDQGIEVICATGRSWLEARSVVQQVCTDGLAIMAGGASLHDIASGVTVQSIDINHALVEHCTESLLRHGHLAHLLKDPDRAGFDYLLVGDAALDAASRWWFDIHPVVTRSAPSLAAFDGGMQAALSHVIRVGTVAQSAELAPLAEALHAEVGEHLSIKHWPALVALGQAGIDTHLLEIFDGDVDKWTMVERVCAMRGIDPAETVAVGDGLNDVGMLRHAGMSYAVENADARVVAVSKRRAPHHDHSALAAVVDDILRESHG